MILCMSANGPQLNKATVFATSAARGKADSLCSVRIIPGVTRTGHDCADCVFCSASAPHELASTPASWHSSFAFPATLQGPEWSKTAWNHV